MAAQIIEFLAGVFMVLFAGYLIGSLLEKMGQRKYKKLHHE